MEKAEMQKALHYLILLGKPNDNFAFMTALSQCDKVGLVTIDKIKSLCNN
jgi:hypothetical protein